MHIIGGRVLGLLAVRSQHSFISDIKFLRFLQWMQMLVLLVKLCLDLVKRI